MATKFDYYDIVSIQTNHLPKSRFNGREGIVRGISEPISGGEPGYAVRIDGEKYVWDFTESELKPTGKKYEGDDYQSMETTNPVSRTSLSPYDEPIEFTQKQILHSIHLGLYDSGVALDEIALEKLLRALAATFQIDQNYVNMFVRAKMRKTKKR